MESPKNRKKIAVIADSGNAVTETFIQNHIQYLPHDVFFIYGSPFPFIYKNNFKLDKFVENDIYIAHLKINLLEYKTEMFTAGR